MFALAPPRISKPVNFRGVSKNKSLKISIDETFSGLAVCLSPTGLELPRTVFSESSHLRLSVSNTTGKIRRTLIIYPRSVINSAALKWEAVQERNLIDWIFIHLGTVGTLNNK